MSSPLLERDAVMDNYRLLNIDDYGLRRVCALSYVDFLPNCVRSGGVFTEPKYERFDVLITRANQWLGNHHEVRAKTAESIELKRKSADEARIDSDKSSFLEWGTVQMRYIRALRLWLVPRKEEDPLEPQHIGYYNVVPVCSEPAGVFSKPRYESFAQTLERLNAYLRKNPIPGKVVNVETQDMKFHTWKETVDPDETYWLEGGRGGTYFLNVIRIFYEVGEVLYEEIGCADFKPQMVEQGSFASHSRYEPFGSVVAHAAQWAALQKDLKIVSVQSVDYKVKSTWSGKELDTHRTMYYEQGKGFTKYMRIIRISYVKTPAGPGRSPRTYPPIALTYRTFIPVQLARDGAFSNPKFESMSETMRRVIHWINHTGVEVVSVETVPIRLFTGQQHGDPEVVYTYDHGNVTEMWLYVIRCFFNGKFTEPPPEALPPVPELKDAECIKCCSIL